MYWEEEKDVLDVPRKRMQGRPKRRRIDSTKHDLTQKWLLGEDRPVYLDATSPKNRPHENMLIRKKKTK